MSIKAIITRGFGTGIGIIKDIITRGFGSGAAIAAQNIDFSVLSASFVERDDSAFVSRLGSSFEERVNGKFV